MIEILIISILSLIIIIETIFFVIIVIRSNEKISEEQKAQLETRTRINDLYEYLKSLKETTIYIEDPLISDIYRNCLSLLDYFDYNYYKKDQEKIVEINKLINQIEDLTGKNVVLTKNDPKYVENPNVENLGVISRI